MGVEELQVPDMNFTNSPRGRIGRKREQLIGVVVAANARPAARVKTATSMPQPARRGVTDNKMNGRRGRLVGWRRVWGPTRAARPSRDDQGNGVSNNLEWPRRGSRGGTQQGKEPECSVYRLMSPACDHVSTLMTQTEAKVTPGLQLYDDANHCDVADDKVIHEQPTCMRNDNSYSKRKEKEEEREREKEKEAPHTPTKMTTIMSKGRWRSRLLHTPTWRASSQWQAARPT